jgi:glycosyl hydrolase family 42 (putative beta-galactosidase)
MCTKKFSGLGFAGAFALALLILPVSAETENTPQSAESIHGIYVYSSDVSQISTNYADLLIDSLNTPGTDGIVLVIGWSAIEPAKGQYQWATLDEWMSRAIASGKKIDLTIKAGVDTPSWLFQPLPNGAGAIPWTFSVSPHSGKTGQCDSETIAAPWDPAFLSRWDSLITALAAHLKSAGTYDNVTLLRLTGINRTTDELRLPAETPQSTGLDCVSDAIAIWQQAGFRPSLLLEAWDHITDSFGKNFPDKTFSVAIIQQNPFPRIAEDGSVIKGTVPDQNQPLLALASQKFPAHLVVQFNFLMPGEAAAPAVVEAALTLGTLPAFQTNNYFGSSGEGAACSEPVTNPTPCTDTTYLEMLETGIYPCRTNTELCESANLQSSYIEVFPANVVAFPNDILQAHIELHRSSNAYLGGK